MSTGMRAPLKKARQVSNYHFKYENTAMDDICAERPAPSQPATARRSAKRADAGKK